MRRASDVVTDLLSDPTLTDDARAAIRDGLERPHMHCPCGRCMRAYLRSVEDAPVPPAKLTEDAVL